MLERVVAELLVWGMRGGLAWLVAYESTAYLEAKLSEISRALSVLRWL